MILAVDVNCDVFDKMREFNISAVFPSLILPHEPRLTVVTSMHFKGQIFGYVGFTYQKAFHIMLDDFFMNWCDAVCSGLNVVQNRLYNEHIKKHIESLSEFVPALGIYNKRGLIRKLMSILTENGEAVLTLHLMTYIKEERVRFDFPPINSIVNAVRLNDSSAILAGIQRTGRIFFGGILGTILSSLWSITSSVIGIFTLLIFIRWIVLLINKGRTSYESGWNQIDMLLNKISYKVAGTFSKKVMSYQQSLLISWIAFLVILGAGHFLILILVNLCYRMPF